MSRPDHAPFAAHSATPSTSGRSTTGSPRSARRRLGWWWWVLVGLVASLGYVLRARLATPLDAPAPGRPDDAAPSAPVEDVGTVSPSVPPPVPEPAALVDLPEGPYGPGSASPLPGGDSPHERFTVKGNAGSMLYHSPASPSYGRTIAEVWFDSEEHAAAAGFERWDSGHSKRARSRSKAAPQDEPLSLPGDDA